MRIAAFFVMTLAVASASASQSVEAWGREFPKPKEALVQVLKNHTKSGAAFISWESNSPGQLADLIDFLSDKGDRTIENYCDRVGKRAAELRKLHVGFPAATQGFRQWVRDNPVAASKLGSRDHVFETLFRDAENAEPVKRKK
jgi:hypothetical protein